MTQASLIQHLEVIWPLQRRFAFYLSDAAKSMVRERDLYLWIGTRMGAASNINYTVVDEGGERLILDRGTGLTWQRGGSPERMGLGSGQIQYESKR